MLPATAERKSKVFLCDLRSFAPLRETLLENRNKCRFQKCFSQRREESKGRKVQALLRAQLGPECIPEPSEQPGVDLFHLFIAQGTIVCLIRQS